MPQQEQPVEPSSKRLRGENGAVRAVNHIVHASLLKVKGHAELCLTHTQQYVHLCRGSNPMLRMGGSHTDAHVHFSSSSKLAHPPSLHTMPR